VSPFWEQAEEVAMGFACASLGADREIQKALARSVTVKYTKNK
jgi:hypothetical protein